MKITHLFLFTFALLSSALVISMNKFTSLDSLTNDNNELNQTLLNIENRFIREKNDCSKKEYNYSNNLSRKENRRLVKQSLYSCVEDALDKATQEAIEATKAATPFEVNEKDTELEFLYRLKSRLSQESSK